MIRLTHENKNTAEEYDRIFRERSHADPNWQDLRRWKMLIQPFSGGKIIDIGCLDSLVLPLAKVKDPLCEAWGIDQSPVAIKTMNRNYPDVHYEVRDVYDTDIPDAYFDYAVMGEVIEHLDDPAAAIKEAIRVLKPRGTLALSTPLNEAKEPGAVDGDRHVWSFTVSDVLDLLKPHGRVRTRLLGSRHFPRYQYAWKTVVAWCRKR